MKDEALLALLANPSSREYGFNMLVRTYSQSLYAIIRRMLVDHDDTDDALQNTWIKVHKGLDGFKGDSSLNTWLYRIASNVALTALAKKKRSLFVSSEKVQRQLAAKVDEPGQFDGDAAQKVLQKALLTLPDKQRLVFNFRYFEEMSYEDMATVTGTSVGALKASYHHAVKKIETIIKGGH